MAERHHATGKRFKIQLFQLETVRSHRSYLATRSAVSGVTDGTGQKALTIAIPRLGFITFTFNGRRPWFCLFVWLVGWLVGAWMGFKESRNPLHAVDISFWSYPSSSMNSIHLSIHPSLS